jgi:hypothetical protein
VVQDEPIAPDSTTLDLSAPSFFEGGPTYRLMQRIGLVKGAGPSVARRSIAAIAVTWLPLLLLSALYGEAIGPTPRTSFLLDFDSYARFFLAVPLIIAAESVVGPRLRNAALRFIDGGIVGPEDYPEFAAAVERVRARREALLPELLIFAVVVFFARSLNVEQLAGLHAADWGTKVVNGIVHRTPAGIWYFYVALPLLQLFFIRLFWRLIIWAMFLWDVSRLHLNLLPTHTDMSAGLGFLGTAHVTTVIIPFAVGCALSAELAFRAVFEGFDLAALKTMVPLLVTYVLFVEVATYSPLLLFVRPLTLAKHEALRRYGILVHQHNQMFHDKWIQGKKQPDEIILGNPDVSSLTDLGTSFLVVRQMTVFPVSRAQFIQTALISCVPGLPLAFLVLPFDQVLKLIAGVLT